MLRNPPRVATGRTRTLEHYVINGDGSDVVHLVETNARISLRGPSDRAPLSARAANANDSEFMIQVTRVPTWLAPGLTVSGEVRCEDGVQCFSTQVVLVLPEGDQTWIMLSQPRAAVLTDERRSIRVAVDIDATWSHLDSDMHPGAPHGGRVHDLSANGMRLDTFPGTKPEDRIVASLPLSSGIVNVIGSVLAIEVSKGAPDQMRVAFSRLDDDTWCKIVDEITDLAGVSRDAALAPSVVHSSLDQRVIRAYASSDRRR